MTVGIPTSTMAYPGDIRTCSEKAFNDWIKGALDARNPTSTKPSEISSSTPAPAPLGPLKIREKRPDEAFNGRVEAIYKSFEALDSSQKEKVTLRVKRAQLRMERSPLLKIREFSGPLPSPLTDVLVKKWAGLGTSDKDFWRLYIKQAHNIDISEYCGANATGDNFEVSSTLKGEDRGIFLVMLNNPNSHCYDVGLPFKVKTTNTRDHGRFGCRARTNKGDNIPQLWSSFRRPEEKELIAHYTKKYFL